MTVRVEKRGPVSTAVLDRPEVRNAVDAGTAEELETVFRQFEEDDEARVGVLWGAGGVFCSGYDLKYLARVEVDQLHDPEGTGPLGVTRLLLSKPVIAAVEGWAVAGGLELALWCDLRVVAEDARLGVFNRRWGVPLLDGGTVRLPRLVGMGRALEMVLTGRPVGAEEALAWGLANRVTDAGHSRRVAEELAQEIARFPQLCLRTDRLSVHRQWGLPLEAALREEARRGSEPLWREARQGAARFVEGAGRGGMFENP